MDLKVEYVIGGGIIISDAVELEGETVELREGILKVDGEGEI